eukprot:2886277-Prorocentrum_lima.AAC.1
MSGLQPRSKLASYSSPRHVGACGVQQGLCGLRWVKLAILVRHRLKPAGVVVWGGAAGPEVALRINGQESAVAAPQREASVASMDE